MKKLVHFLKERGLTIGSCESLTAGLFVSSMAEISGASAVLKGGLITYQTICKETLAHVPHALIETYGVISAPCVEAMARGAQSIIDCDICVSFSGNAGPDLMEGKPVGYVYCGLAIKEELKSYACQFEGTRNEIRRQCIDFMCLKIMEEVKEREAISWKNKK